jgi:hypothetical protein
MYSKSINYSRSCQLLGDIDHRANIEIDNNHPFVAFIRSAIAESAEFQLQNATDAWDKVGLNKLCKSILNPSVRNIAQKLCKPYPKGGAFTEAVINAIEHGAQWGEQGPINIGLGYNQRGFQLTACDPGKGFDPDEILTAKPDPQSQRGNGLIQLQRCPAIVTCDTFEGKFRVAITYTTIQ